MRFACLYALPITDEVVEERMVLIKKIEECSS